MATLYVKQLFALLRFLNIDQQDVVNTLGVNKTQVSLWAHGKRPVSKRQTLPFVMFVRDAISRARTTAWIHNSWPARPSLMDSRGTAERFEDQINKQLQLWRLEFDHTSGRLEQDYREYAHTLQRYLYLSPDKLSEEERAAIRVAGNGVLRTLRTLARLHDRPEETEGRPLPPPPAADPVDYFDWLVDMWTRLPQDEEDEPHNE